MRGRILQGGNGDGIKGKEGEGEKEGEAGERPGGWWVLQQSNRRSDINKTGTRQRARSKRTQRDSDRPTAVRKGTSTGTHSVHTTKILRGTDR
jgi:hypothetical protein